ncbi:MAG TPA: metal-dependent transcriptional regulator [Flavisolibacter sp.]|nr:metal-dependent transcriptional regulator [Flavisolibacter sp.]
MNFSSSEENYLKAIYHLQTEADTVSTSALAQQLNAKPASITDMMKKLSAKGLLNYKPYYGFTLSVEGKKAALTIIRRHRLWEFFLAQKLGFKWDEVHEVAEELEHVSSKKLIEKLDAYLGFPEFDPHGDPIPDTRGRVRKVDHIALTKLSVNQLAVVQSIANQSPDVLDFLHQKNIGIGTTLEIVKRHAFDGSLEIKVRKTLITITPTLSEFLFVKKV